MVQFRIDPQLLGLVIGKSGLLLPSSGPYVCLCVLGKNIKRAEKEEGVQNVRIDNEGATQQRKQQT